MWMGSPIRQAALTRIDAGGNVESLPLVASDSACNRVISYRDSRAHDSGRQEAFTSYQQNLKRLVLRSVLSLVAVFVILIVLGSSALAQKIVQPRTPISQDKVFGLRAPDQSNDPFFQVVPYGTGGQAVSFVAAADLNGDGKPDLIVGTGPFPDSENSSVEILPGNGDGTFQPGVTYDVGAPGANTFSVGDLNHDGKPDLIVASSGFISVLLGNGDGSLKPAVVYSSGGRLVIGQSVPPLLTDLNGDGKLDVIVVNHTDNNNQDGSAAVFLGNGDGTLQPAKLYDSGGYLVSSIAVADLNADGVKDLVVLNCAASGSTDCSTTGAMVGVLLGKGDGTFRSVQSYPRGGLGESWSPVTVADYNNDGIPDLLVGNTCKVVGSRCPADATVSLFAGNGDGTFHSAVNYDSGGYSVGSIGVMDIYGDGKLDLVLGNWNSAAVLRGNGDGTFRFPDSYLNYSDAGVGVLVADVNGDGKPDIISNGHTSVFFVSVLLGNGSGFAAPFYSFYAASQPIVSDLNLDGRPDLATPGFCDNRYCSGDVGLIGVLLNNPGFIYKSTVTKVTSTPDPAAPNQPVTYTVTVTNPARSTLSGNVVCYAHPKNYTNAFFQGPLVNNQAVFSIQYSSTGTHQVQCQYSGDTDNLGSISLNLSEYIKVLPVGSKTILGTSGSPSHVGEPVTFTAHVTSKFGDIPDGEQVTFYDGTKVLGSAALSGATAALTTSSLSAKKHTIKAVYSGDSAFKPSQGTVIQLVQ